MIPAKTILTWCLKWRSDKIGKKYEFFEGYSAGFMIDKDTSEIQEALERDGVTLVHYRIGGRRLFLDDEVNPEYADVLKRTQKCIEVTEVPADRRSYPEVQVAVGYEVRELNYALLAVSPEVEEEVLPYIPGMFSRKNAVIERSMKRRGLSDDAKDLLRFLMKKQ